MLPWKRRVNVNAGWLRAVAELSDDRTPSASIHHRKSVHVGRFSPELGKLANVNVGLRGQRVSDAFVNVSSEKLQYYYYCREREWCSGEVLRLRSKGSEVRARISRLRFQRMGIPCFQVAIWLKYFKEI